MLGFTSYRLHENADDTFVTPILVYDGKVYVLDDVATKEVGNRNLTTDEVNSKLAVALFCKEIEDLLELRV